ncbi:MAG: DUF1553 domain-containing protein [Pirellulaceae bacterium]
MRRMLICSVAACAVGAACQLIANESATVLFEKDVRPILKAHCFHCHGESGVLEGTLDLRLSHLIHAGGESGAAIVPGDPARSLLLERIKAGEMPPDDKRLADHELSVLEAWIEQGAKTARPEPQALAGGEYITEEERRFWAFQPVQRPLPPQLSNDHRVEIVNEIDAFILANLQSNQLTFSPAARPLALLRRVSFDLLGIPPEPEMVREFLADSSPGAYARLVDRLLADPRYGERWGRHWLDVAGYADSEGYTNQDTEREFAYFYRDYVIRSFNDNKPLDQFICEQLAGDEMNSSESADLPETLTTTQIERLAATGFLRMAPDGTAAVGGNDRSEAANETLADTINILSTSLLGLTVGCARCHDHRYDPISQADYYRMRAILEPALDVNAWKTPAERRVSLYTAADHAARAVVEEQAKAAEQARTLRQQEHLDRTLQEELLVAPDELQAKLRSAYKTAKDDRSEEQLTLLEDYPNIANISPGSLYLYAEQRARRAGDIERARSEREQEYLSRIRAEHLNEIPSERRAEIATAAVVPVAERNEIQQALAKEYPGVFVTAETLANFDPIAAERLQEYQVAAEQCRKLDAKTELAKLQEEIAAIRATAPKENFLRALVEPTNHLPVTHLFVRGDHNQPAQELEPAELQVLQTSAPADIPSNNAQLPTSGRRLAYARHLTSGNHPLVARVLVNRVWMHHFGRGIVETPADFGRLGSRPTHPLLLDWLADELVRSGWNLKHMHRLILLSRTYQQSSNRTAHLDEVDPDNRWLARMSVRRLESEAIRDSVLAVSESLSAQMYGPPVPVKEDAVGQIVLGKEMLDGERKPTGEDKDSEDTVRRSIYVQVRRTRPLATLETFDVASTAPNCVSRSFSNVAMQPLLMMNSQFIIDHSERLAERLIAEHQDVAAQLRSAWVRCFSEEIDASMLEQLEAFVERQAAQVSQQDTSLSPEEVQRRALASACHAMLSSNAFVYVD